VIFFVVNIEWVFKGVCGDNFNKCLCCSYLCLEAFIHKKSFKQTYIMFRVLIVDILFMFKFRIICIKICIDARNEYGESALFYAARRNMPALVRLLLQRGCDIDLIDRFIL
jgi:ankyrin repeat protein